MEQPPSRPPEPPPAPDLQPIVLRPEVTRPLIAGLKNLIGEDLKKVQTPITPDAGSPLITTPVFQDTVKTIQEASSAIDGLFTTILERVGELKVSPKIGGGDFQVLSESIDPPPPNSSITFEGSDKFKFFSALNHNLRNHLHVLGFVTLIGEGRYGAITPALKTQAETITDAVEAIKRKLQPITDAKGLTIQTDAQGQTTFSLIEADKSTQ